MRAYSLLRRSPPYRAEAFEAGLAACGYRVHVAAELPQRPSPEDVLLLWNRQGAREDIARHFEAHGAPVLVAENGYLGREWRGGHWYALALDHHNGAGRWRPGGPERWDAWAQPLRPWRLGGDHVLVLPQRGIGPRGVAMPAGWERGLRLRTGRRIVVRPHPGERPARPLEEDLRDAWCVVTWGSGAALKALVAGIPVFHAFDRWIGAPAAAPLDPDDLEHRWLGDRAAMFRRLAWAMWSVEELATGAPFRRLLCAS